MALGGLDPGDDGGELLVGEPVRDRPRRQGGAAAHVRPPAGRLERAVRRLDGCVER